MTTTALLDINVVLDVLLDRQPFVDASGAVWRACDAGRVRGYLCAATFPTVFYIVHKAVGHEKALEAIDACLAAFEVAPVYRESIEAARRMAGDDFEDNLQIACAVTSLLDYVVTRNAADFAASPVPVLSPAEFLGKIEATGGPATS